MLPFASIVIAERPLLDHILEKEINQLFLFGRFILHPLFYVSAACTNENTSIAILKSALNKDCFVKLILLSVHIMRLQHLVPHCRQVWAILESTVTVIDTFNIFHQ